MKNSVAVVGFVVNENRARESLRESRVGPVPASRCRLARAFAPRSRLARARARPSSASCAPRSRARRIHCVAASPRPVERAPARREDARARITAAGSRHAPSRRAGRRRASVPARDGRTRRAERHASRGARWIGSNRSVRSARGWISCFESYRETAANADASRHGDVRREI